MALLCRNFYNNVGLDLTRPLDLRNTVPRGDSLAASIVEVWTNRYPKKIATNSLDLKSSQRILLHLSSNLGLFYASVHRL